MQTITDISEKRVGSYIVSIDGEPIGALSPAAIADLGFGVGDTLDVKALDKLRDAIAEQVVFDKAVELLGVSQRSTRDLQRRLVQKGAGKVHVEAAIIRLAALGYLDDSAFAESLVRSRLVEGGSSKRRVEQILLRKGVARSVADEAIQRAIDENGTDERVAALQVARKRLKTLRSLDPATRKRRLYGFLARRGYDAGAISLVLRDLGSELALSESADLLDIEEGLNDDIATGDE
ncbi:MAG: regulatory protein RecX [Gemmatimonadaceae bacterium]